METDKSRFVWIISATVAVFLLFQPVISAGSPGTNYPPMVPMLPMGPVITDTTENSTMIRIVSNVSCTPSAVYSNDSWFSGFGTYDHRITCPSSGTTHAIPFAGLEPATSYHYQVSGCGIDETDRKFTTFPASGSCTFVVYGDAREQAPLYNQTERHKIVADRISQEPGILFVINSGDLVAENDNPSEWARFFDATDTLRSMTTYFATPGNHDADRPLFRDLFGTDGAHYFDCGNARIIMLDSTDASSMTLAEQAKWMVSDAGQSGKATIAVLHHPVYSSDEKHYGGYENLQRVLVPAFQGSGVRLVFNSHVHVFEQVKRNGITYITEARGGAPSYPLDQTRIPGSINAYENTLGYSRVTVDPEAVDIRVDVIRVADVSMDLRKVTKIYPFGTVDSRILIPVHGPTDRLQEISGQLCLLNDGKDPWCPHNSEANVGNWLP